MIPKQNLSFHEFFSMKELLLISKVWYLMSMKEYDPPNKKFAFSLISRIIQFVIKKKKTEHTFKFIRFIKNIVLESFSFKKDGVLHFQCNFSNIQNCWFYLLLFGPRSPLLLDPQLFAWSCSRRISSSGKVLIYHFIIPPIVDIFLYFFLQTVLFYYRNEIM